MYNRLVDNKLQISENARDYFKCLQGDQAKKIILIFTTCQIDFVQVLPQH